LLIQFDASKAQRPITVRFDSSQEFDERGFGFPRWELDDELLEEVVVLDGSGATGALEAAFLSDENGNGLVLASYPGVWRVLDEFGQPSGTRAVEGFGGGLQQFIDGDGTAYSLELRGDESFRRHTEVICRRGDEILWRRESRKLDWKGCDPIRLEDGRVLVLCHGFEDLVAIRPDGEAAWERDAERHASYGHRTHPDLPGVYLCCFGRVSWHRASDGDRIGAELEFDDLYVTSAEPFSDPEGERLAFVVGSRGDRGGIAVIDSEGGLRWSSQTPENTLDLARLDRADGSSLFAVTTRGGNLFLIDGEGTVVHHRSLPQEPDPEIGVAVREITSGPLGDEHVGLAITFIQWVAVYRMRR
jgi:hypothetical protein